MRLISAHIRNFKLLEDVRLDFSTSSQRPLTVIRAENGSGKTSLLYAFQWAFFGVQGLPASAASLRLTSTATPSNTPTSVSVSIEFERDDEFGVTARYRLMRSVVETPTAGNKFEREPERLRLLELTAGGDEDREPAESWINAWLPKRLKDVFFTDGDSVQTFISGQIATRQRQGRVQHAIRDLLGIESFQIAADDLDAVYRALRVEAAKAGGKDTSNLEVKLEETDARICRIEEDLNRFRLRQANMNEQYNAWEKEFRSIQGIGDIEELHERIDRAETEQARLEGQRGIALQRMQASLKSEESSWLFLEAPMRIGLEQLSDLADRRIIPGASVEVLVDRLALRECICGQSLGDGTKHREHVKHLLNEQRSVSESRQRLSSLLHLARRAEADEFARRESRRSFQDVSAQLLSEFTDINDALRAKDVELKDLRNRRNSIDEERVRILASRLQDVEVKIARGNRDIGAKEMELEQARLEREHQDDALREAERQVAISDELEAKRDVAEDLSQLASDVLSVLEVDYVKRVSRRMKDLFMEIVGAPDDPVRADFGPVLFAGVHFDDDFNMIIDTYDDRRLDPDFELNGASKRALTLSFIWALMEVSGATSPRIIDTPLGMVSGGVKYRMVDAITKPPADDLPALQVILFLTRSELRDVEELIDDRAGSIMTLSCSEHYPVDLRYSWGSGFPMSRMCLCDHRHSCRICARRYDDRHGVLFRDTELVAS